MSAVLPGVLRGALCLLLAGSAAGSAAGAESAATGPRPPFELTRSLQALQDQMALGSRAAGVAQRTLLMRIGDEFMKAPRGVWREPANARAAIVYVLNGGRPLLLRKLLDDGDLPEAQSEIARGALAYATGRREAAWSILAEVDARALPPSLGAHVALVQASLTMQSDPESAAGYLATARLLAPGTLIEDAALRRELSVVSELADVEGFVFLARQYIRRFPNSVYAPNFVRAFPQLWSGLGLASDEAALGKLDAIVAGLEVESRRELYLALARHGLVVGDIRLADFAAIQAAEMAGPGSAAATRAALYKAAAEVAGSGPARAAERLGAIDPATLSAPDAELHAAVLAVADQVWSEIEAAGAPADAGALGASGVLGRGQEAIAAADTLLRSVK
jgi:chemotaxis protein MotC